MAKVNDLVKKPLEIGEVIVDAVLKTDASVDLESNASLELGSVVYTTDSGKTFKKLGAELPATPYRLGILGENVTDSRVVNIVLVGKVKKVGEVATAVETKLFEQNLILL